MNRSRHSGYLPAILVLLVLLLAGCGKAPKLPALAANDVIVAFGDSLTYGTGAGEEESYPVVLGQLINRQVVRAGVPGEVTAQGLQRLPQMLDEHRPQLVIVCLGGNDMLRRADPAQTKANLRAMLRMLKERGIAAVLVGVPRPALLAGAPEFYEELAREFAIPYEGGIVKDVLYSADTKSDPIHPNAEGYRRMAQAIAELLRKAGAI
ncbi:MAG: arylesterase [Burkholderiales bacterium]|nr:arylesterase [Burkholderiales bacterium]